MSDAVVRARPAAFELLAPVLSKIDRAFPKAVHAPASPVRQGRGRDLAVLALLAMLWIAAHPIYGVIHDARLYTIQALNALHPGRYAQDLYFRYGNQDSFTVFSAIYKPLVAAIGIGPAQMAATIVGQAAWFAALIFFMRSLFGRGREFLVATIACMLLDPGYGGFSVFRYGEAFATPRIFAEALMMTAFALTLRGRWLWAGPPMLFAAALHPIMAVAGAAVLAGQVMLHDRRAWIFAVAGPFCVVGLAIAHVSPFDRLLLRFDPAWFAVVRDRCGFGIVSRWTFSDFLKLAAQGAVLAVAWRLGRPAERRLFAALALAALLAILAAAIGGDLLRNILVVNVQPWRVLWVAALLCNGAMGVIAMRLPPSWISRDLFAAAAILSGLATFFWALPATWCAVAVAGALAYGLESRRGAGLPPIARLAFFALPCLGAAAMVCLAALQIRSPNFPGALTRAAFAAGALGLLWLTLRRGVGPWLVGILVLAVAAPAAADQRNASQRFVETPGVPADLKAFVGDARTLYWEYGVELVWLKLQRPDYYHCLQGSGAMFYAGTAAEYARKTEALRIVDTRDYDYVKDGICPSNPRQTPRSAYDPAAVAAACRALPDLDVMVLSRPVTGRPAPAWRAPAVQYYRGPDGSFQPVDTFYRYSCQDFR